MSNNKFLSSCNLHNQSYIYPLKEILFTGDSSADKSREFFNLSGIKDFREKRIFHLIMMSVVSFIRFCYLTCPCTFSAVVRNILAQ